MNLQITDYNQAEEIIRGTYESEWKEISQVLNSMPLYLKGSDQAGMQGKGIFDPVATNQHIRNELTKVGWGSLPIPEDLSFLGVDVDFAKPGMILEVQFPTILFC